MKALSILQPWAWLICHAADYPRPKRIENRDWRAAPSFRGRFLVHAGKKYDRRQFEDVAFMRPDLGPMLAAAARSDIRYGGIVGYAELADVYRIEDRDHDGDGWAFGPLCFELRCARPLPFMPLRGALGLFDVDIAALGIALND